MTRREKRIATPCVKICKIEEDICIGCGRSLTEIAQWLRFDDAARARLIEEATQRLRMRAMMRDAQ